MTEKRFVDPLLSSKLLGIANLRAHYGARQFCQPSFGPMTSTLKTLGSQLLEHDGTSLYRVAPGSTTPRIARESQTKIKIDLGTYRLKIEVDRVTADSADVVPSGGPKTFQSTIAEALEARTMSQAEKGAVIYELLEIAFEIEMGDILGNAALWTHSATLAGTAKFSHPASDPIKRIEQLIDDCGGATKIAMGRETWRALSFNPKVISGIPAARASHKLTYADFKAFAASEWMIDDVVVSRARRKAPDGSFSFLWSDFLHVGSPGENLVPVGQEFSVNQQTMIRVVNPVPEGNYSRGRVAGVDGNGQDGYLMEILDDPDAEITELKLSRRGAIVPLVAEGAGTLLDCA